MIISILDRKCGFFSIFFFVMNHYLYAKKKNVSFKLNTDNWLFKCYSGWEDYFINIDTIIDNGTDNIEYYNHGNQPDNAYIFEYKDIIKEIYKYNEKTKQKIYETKEKLNLLNCQDYDSIFIRRGDKLIYESDYYESSKYIECLLIKNPNCHTIFLQTDDYNSYIDLQNYIKINNLNINLITMCDENLKGGVVVFDVFKNRLNEGKNKNYMQSNINNLLNNTPVNMLNKEDLYIHTINMIIGLDIVFNSNICICDYSSNVARFIKLAHNNINNVFNILNPDVDINLNQVFCPADVFP